MNRPKSNTNSLRKIKEMNRRLINIEEVAHMLDMKTGTIYKWVTQRRIPFVKGGRLTKFDLEKIERWIEGKSIEEKHFG